MQASIGINLEVAEKYGINEAVLIDFFHGIIKMNRIQNENFIEGRTWERASSKNIAVHLPFFSVRQISKALKYLVDSEVLLKNHFNGDPRDNTLWYAFKDEEKFGI